MDIITGVSDTLKEHVFITLLANNYVFYVPFSSKFPSLSYPLLFGFYYIVPKTSWIEITVRYRLPTVE